MQLTKRKIQIAIGLLFVGLLIIYPHYNLNRILDGLAPPTREIALSEYPVGMVSSDLENNAAAKKFRDRIHAQEAIPFYDKELTKWYWLVPKRGMREIRVRTYTLRGDAYRTLGNYDAAIEDYSAAIENRPGRNRLPNRPSVRYRRAMVYIAKHDWQSALLDLNEAVSYSTEPDPYRMERARVYEKLLDFERARDDYRKVKKNKSLLSDEAAIREAGILIRMGRQDEAAQVTKDYELNALGK